MVIVFSRIEDMAKYVYVVACFFRRTEHGDGGSDGARVTGPDAGSAGLRRPVPQHGVQDHHRLQGHMQQRIQRCATS